MEEKYVIILSGGREYLCCHEDGCYYDVPYPIRPFAEGKEDFEIMGSGQDRYDKTCPCHKRKLKLVPGSYPNGWLALSLGIPETEEACTVLTVNLEDFPIFGTLDRTSVNINNNPGAMDLLIRYNLTEDTGYRCRSGWVEYPMIKLSLPELYRTLPIYFEESRQQSVT